MILLASTTQIPFLTEIVVILGLSILVIFIFQKLNIPAVLGFLATGVMFGPHAIGFVQAGEEIEILSEIGVILLLFIIGLEFSLKSLMSMKKVVLIGGSMQVGLTILLSAAGAYLLGFAVNKAFFLGFLIALSSTAIVLKVLQDKGLMRTPHGRIALGILIFQDIIVVPMMLLTPILAGQDSNVLMSLLVLAVKVILVIGMVYILARHLVPRILHEIARTRSRELFLITIIVICFSVAYFTSVMGLSLALGAFMAGLCISESEYSHQATGLIIPFREIFTSFFFVSIGMLLDLGFVYENLAMVVLLTLGVFVLKFSIITLSTLALKYPLKTGVIVGFSLFQVGEFAFILSRSGMDVGLLNENTYQYFLSVSILTMGITPFLIDYGDRLALGLLKTPFKKLAFMENSRSSPEPEAAEIEDLNGHLIIIGYGTNGQNAARTARKAGIPYVILELDADIVRKASLAGEPIIFGDARNSHILDHVRIFKARVAVVAVADHDDALVIVSQIREICKTVHIVIRAKTIAQSEELLMGGATEAISEEFEASVEVFARMLNQFLVSNDDIDQYIETIRDETYSSIHSNYHVYKRNAIELSKLKTATIFLHKDSLLNDKHLVEANIFQDNKVRVVGILRNGNLFKDFNGDSILRSQDEIIITGSELNVNIFLDQWSELNPKKMPDLEEVSGI